MCYEPRRIHAVCASGYGKAVCRVHGDEYAQLTEPQRGWGDNVKATRPNTSGEDWKAIFGGFGRV